VRDNPGPFQHAEWAHESSAKRATISPDTRVDELHLKPKALRIFVDNGLKTLRDLAVLPEAELWAQHGIGRSRWKSSDRSCVLPASGLRRPPTRSPGCIGKTASAARSPQTCSHRADDAGISALGFFPPR